MGIVRAIGKKPVCLDSCVFIYFIEEDKRYIDIVAPIFDAVGEGLISAVTSGITLLETLVVPLRNKDIDLANQYEQILCESEGLTCLELDRDLLRMAAHLRATFSMKTPDALQIAAAKRGGCGTFVTNDRRFPKIPGLKILQLSDYLDVLSS